MENKEFNSNIKCKKCIAWRKEFIRLLKEKIKGYRTTTYNYKFLKELERYLDKLAGDLANSKKDGEPSALEGKD